MPIGAGGILGAVALGAALGLALVPAAAQSGGTWTDPPVRKAAPAISAPADAPAASGTAEPKAVEQRSVDSKAAQPDTAQAKAPPPPKAAEPKAAEPAVAEAGRSSGGKAGRVAARAARAAPPRVAVREPRRVREVPQRFAVPAPRPSAPRFVERREVRPLSRRVAARPFTPRLVEAQPYPYAPLPVGRVEGGTDGERNPIFDEGADRTRRIAAAQAAGYLVVRARTVQFPDGRVMRAYRPYDGGDLD